MKTKSFNKQKPDGLKPPGFFSSLRTRPGVYDEYKTDCQIKIIENNGWMWMAPDMQRAIAKHRDEVTQGVVKGKEDRIR